MNLMFWRRNADQPAPPSPEEEVRELLSAYLDGELSASEEATAQDLLDRDPAAREELDELALLVSALGNLGAEVRAPRSFTITAPAGTASERPLPSFRRMELLFRASAVAASVMFAVVLFTDSGETPITAPAMTSMSQEAALEAPSAAGLAAPESGARLADVPPEAPAPAAGAASLPDEGGPAAATDAGASSMAAEPGASAAAATANDGSEAATDTTMGTMSEMAPAPNGAELLLAPKAAPDVTSGTFEEPATSDGVGGMAAALGTTAGLLIALSALLAWNRRANDRPRSSQ